jgi:fructose-1-phosphate kinase PfkB-like protein
MSPLILTFTGNPLSETTYEMAGWEPGRTQRAKACSFQMGGKGINVSRMLARLGARTRILSFLGGNSGEDCRAWLKERALELVSIPTRHATRGGLVLRDAQQPETTFLGVDTAPDEEAWLAAAKALVAERREGACLAFCGSCPGFAAPEAALFRAALDGWIADGLPVYVDTYGAPLAWFAERPVELIKINADELAGLLSPGASGNTEANLRSALSRWNALNWIISDGPNPVWHAGRSSAPSCQVPPEVRVVSPTGSGDVLLACLLHARLNLGQSWDQALAYALPQAAANAAHPGIAEF